MQLKLPAPCLVVLVGPSGSGKTSWAEEHFAENEVVSSDALRAMAGIDEDDQTASTVAFELLERIVSARLTRRLTTVIDTTGLNRDNRVSWVEAGHAAELPVYAVLFDADFDTIKSRNAIKGKPIPQSVLRKQLSAFRHALKSIDGEGFDDVHRQQPVRAVTATLTQPAPPAEAAPGHSFGLLVSRFDWVDGDFGDRLARIAWRAEDAGFTDLWVMDHFRQIHQVGRVWEDMPEAYTALSFVAGVTSRIRLGALVSGVTHRNPAVLGKMIATLDVLSGGRAICGLGAAWDDKEHAAYGIEFPSLAERFDLLEDTLRMLPLLWGKGSPPFVGKVISAKQLICYPRPVQDRIPILVGGSGERKTLRLVAQYADAANLFGGPEVVKEKVEVLHRHCADLDRDPREITVTHLVPAMVAADSKSLRERINQTRARNTTIEDFSAQHNAGLTDDLVGLISRYGEAGADHSIVTIPDVGSEGSIEAFADVIAAFRDE